MTIPPKGRARCQDQGGTDLCSLYAIANATVETLMRDNVDVSLDEVVAKLEQLEFVKVKDGHHVQEFNGVKLKILKDRTGETGMPNAQWALALPIDVTLEIKEHVNIGPELLQRIKGRSSSCVLDYTRQDCDGERHCVFIDTVKTLNGINWILYTLFFQWIPWVSKSYARDKFICINSWGPYDKNPEIDVYQKGKRNRVFEVKGTVQRLESEYKNADIKNIAMSIYNEMNWSLWTLMAFMSVACELCNVVTNPNIGYLGDIGACHDLEHCNVVGLHVMIVFCTFLWVLLMSIHNHSLFWFHTLKQNGKNKTRWNIIGAVVKFSIDFLFFVSSMVLSALIFILPLTIIWNLVGIRKFFTEPSLVIFFYIFEAECDKINQQQTGNESGSTKGFFTFLGCVRLLYSLILMYYSNSKDDIGNPERNTTSLLQITPIECKDILDV